MRLSLNGRTSLTVRLTGLFATASTAVLLLLGYLVTTSVEQHFEQQDMEVLNGKLELVEHPLVKVRSQDELAKFPSLLADSLVGHHSLDILVVSADGTVLFSTRNAQFPDTLLRAAGPTIVGSAVWRKERGHPVRGIAKRAATGIVCASPATIAISSDVGHHEHFMGGFQRTLWGVVGLGAVLTGALG